MTNEELKCLIAEVEGRLGEKFDQLRTEVHDLRTVITGDGKPDKGLLFRFERVEGVVNTLKKAALAFALAGCTALGTYAVNRHFSAGEPSYDKAVTSRPSR